jgi:hypothetical protein
MHLRLYYQQLGGHFHCRLFSAPEPHFTHGKNGDLVFDEREWPSAKVKFESIAEVIDETSVVRPRNG